MAAELRGVYALSVHIFKINVITSQMGLQFSQTLFADFDDAVRDNS